MEEEKSQPKKIETHISKPLKKKKVIYPLLAILIISLIGGILYLLEENNLLIYTISPTKQEKEKEEIIEEEDNDPSEEYGEYEEPTIDYEMGKITTQSIGLLYLIEYISYDDPSNSEVYFVFKDTINSKYINISGNLYEDSGREDGAFGSYPFRPVLVNNDIYFLFGQMDPLTQVVLKRINIYTGTVTTIPLQNENSKSIHSYFIEDQTVYYLTGTPCSSYMSTCDLELKSYNMTTNKTQLLAQHLTSRDILGLDSTKTKLITAYQEGDAGCVWGSFEQYDTVSKIKSNLEKFDFCYDLDTGDLIPGDEKELAKFQNISNIVKGMGYAQFVILSEGKITLPTENEVEQNYLYGQVGFRIKQ